MSTNKRRSTARKGAARKKRPTKTKAATRARAQSPEASIDAAALARELYAAFSHGDIDFILERLHPHVVWEHDSTDHGVPWLVPGRGVDHARSFFATLASELDIKRFEVVNVMGNASQAVGICRLTATVRKTGKPLVDYEAHVWTFDDRGRVTAFRHLVDTHRQWLASRPDAPDETDEIASLVGGLAATAAPARRDAAAALGVIAKNGSRDARLLAPLVKVLDDANGEVRHAATTALGWLGYKGGVVDASELEPCLRLLEDEVALVRHDAAWILESCAQRGIFDTRAVPLLEANCDHADPDVRAASLFCLGHLAKVGALTSDELRATATPCAIDPDDGVKKAVGVALAIADKLSGA